MVSGGGYGDNGWCVVVVIQVILVMKVVSRVVVALVNHSVVIIGLW